jgi:hypothetical protein
VTRIDREAVVRRHVIHLTGHDAISPLTVGNGELAFTADVTGMQTFPEAHDLRVTGGSSMPLATQAQWGFHEMPNSRGYSLEDVMRTYDSPHGPIRFPVEYDYRVPEDNVPPEQAPGHWLWVNPQRLDLARVGLELRSRPGSEPERDVWRVTDVDQRLDLWEGTLHSKFAYAGAVHEVITLVHPDEDAIAFRVVSEALGDGRTTVVVEFPYASDTFGGTSDWSRPEAHRTETISQSPTSIRLRRTLNETRYETHLRFSAGTRIDIVGPHRLRLTVPGPLLDLVVSFAPEGEAPPMPTYAEAVDAARSRWPTFWRTGAAVDLSESSDPRAHELERRIVLSQFITATQCAGRYPSAETGLVHNSWAGKFNLEMHWWHAAHFAMWGRPELLDRSCAWYVDALPIAREIAASQGLPGARWPKHVGPTGRESPNVIGPLLLWQQPHPIHLAELLRLAGSPGVEERYQQVVDESAEFLAAWLSRADDGRYHLGPPIMPAQERYDPTTVYDPTFELAYTWWALSVAQQWRERAGVPRRPDWDERLAAFATPPQIDGAYAAIGSPARRVNHDHPSMLGALGVVPRTPLVEDAVMRRTLAWVVENWQWEIAWGWDFPMLSMCASRMGDGTRAVEALLMPTPRNRYLPNGHNCQDPDRLPLYVPGNGGLLAAIALLVGGALDTPPPELPDGWSIRSEGFAPRP